jgi:hypothetical protein
MIQHVEKRLLWNRESLALLNEFEHCPWKMSQICISSILTDLTAYFRGHFKNGAAKCGIWQSPSSLGSTVNDVPSFILGFL